MTPASTLDPLDVAIICVKLYTCSRQNHVTCSLCVRAMSPAPGWPIIPELFSILGYAYYSQNYSGIISASLTAGASPGGSKVTYAVKRTERETAWAKIL